MAATEVATPGLGEDTAGQVKRIRKYRMREEVQEQLHVLREVSQEQRADAIRGRLEATTDLSERAVRAAAEVQAKEDQDGIEVVACVLEWVLGDRDTLR